MDLGIAGRNAIVCASSKGLGKACAQALAREGVNVWISARHRDTLDQAAAEIAKLEKRMYRHARDLEFEEAARLRDEIEGLRQDMLETPRATAG